MFTHSLEATTMASIAVADDNITIINGLTLFTNHYSISLRLAYISMCYFLPLVHGSECPFSTAVSA